MLIKNFCIACLIFFSMTVYAKNTWTVQQIYFKGLKTFSPNDTLKHITFGIGSQISPYDINNSIKLLFKTGRFEDIKVTHSSGTIITFYLQERPIVSSVVTSGNHIINNFALDKYLKQLNFTKGSVFNPAAINTFIKTIKDFYYDSGKSGSDVKILKCFSKYNTVDLKILINEGVSTKINNIEIRGNNNFSQEQLLSVFKLKKDQSWWHFLDKSTYSPQELDSDLNRLNNLYLNNGYYYFNINGKKLQFFHDKHYINIAIDIFEGKQYKISDVFITGNFSPYKDFIEHIVNIYPEELYNKEKINVILNNIIRLLSEYGYINAKITVNPKINHITNKIILYFNIDLQKRYIVRRIHFQGNELTKDEVLRREIKQIEGRYLNVKLIESGKEALEKTKYFSEVKVIQNLYIDNSNQVDITYQVKERPTGAINFGLGYGMDSGISFNTSFSQENIFGSGNSLKVSAIKNHNQKYTDLSIRYPFFFANHTDFNTRFFYNNLNYNFNNISNLEKNTYGFEGDLGFFINDNNRLNFGLGYTHNGIVNLKKEKIISVMKQAFDINFLKNSLVNDFTLNYSWIYDSLRSFYFPFSGNQTYISGKNTIPGSDNNFYKIILDSEEFIPLDEQHHFIFLSHLHMGMGSGFDKEKLPFYENFYANSMSNIRGFRTNTIGPKKIYNNSDSEYCIGYKNNNRCESIDSIGGNSTFITNFEIITPIPFINHEYSQLLRSSFFLDAGNIWNTNWNNIRDISSFSFLKKNIFDDIYASFGFSLQWFSPIGPLVFSYALPIQKNVNHQLEAFQFNFGKNW